MKCTKALYEDAGVINNIGPVCFAFQKLCSDLADKEQDEIIDILNTSYNKDSNLYFASLYVPAKDSIGSEFMWIDSGFYTKNGDKIFTQLRKTTFTWVGGYTGTAMDIVNNQINYQSKSNSKKRMLANISTWIGIHQDLCKKSLDAVPEDIEKKERDTEQKIIPKVIPVPEDKKQTIIKTNAVMDQVSTILPDEEKFYNAFYDKLLVKVGWTPTLIKEYLYSMILRENYLLANNRGDSFILRSNNVNSKNYVMMNTALLNSLGNPIKLIIQLYDTSGKGELCIQCRFWEICDSKKTAMDYGFSRDDINCDIDPVVYYDNDPGELVFSADIDDFDLENEERFIHCIDRNAERGNESFVNLTDNQIYSSIVQAIRTGVTISKYDSSFVRPMYSRKANRIMFIIPYHINGKFETAPELGILVSKGAYGLWQVVTILDYDMVVRDCACLVPYRASSF